MKVKCPECDGLGEWDEGPINCGGPAPVDPIYRQVICPSCNGSGVVTEEPREKIPAETVRDEDEPKF